MPVWHAANTLIRKGIGRQQGRAHPSEAPSLRCGTKLRRGLRNYLWSTNVPPVSVRALWTLGRNKRTCSQGGSTESGKTRYGSVFITDFRRKDGEYVTESLAWGWLTNGYAQVLGNWHTKPKSVHIGVNSTIRARQHSSLAGGERMTCSALPVHRSKCHIQSMRLALKSSLQWP